MIERGEFFEYAEYVGEFYGTPKKPILECIESGKDVLLEIEVQGAQQIMAASPNAITVFLDPPSLEELERRLRGRGTDSEEKLAARLGRAQAELVSKSVYEYIVKSDDVDRAAREILSIIDQGASQAHRKGMI
jgi:guanylate kinase